eukprot:364738_1
MREPSLGNWSECIIVMGNNIHGEQFNYVYTYFKCLNVYHLDITTDPLKQEFPHVHYWKTYIMLHPFFRSNPKLFRYIMYLDSDCITIKPIRKLIEKTVSYMLDKYGPHYMDHKWLAWREDYRHQSMYKAVLSVEKYDEKTLNELKKRGLLSDDIGQIQVIQTGHNRTDNINQFGYLIVDSDLETSMNV